MQLPAAMKFCWLAGILSRTFKTTAGINHRYFSICAYSFLSMPFVEKHIPTPKISINVFRFRDTVLSL